jgi:hypothetical protein
VEQAGKPIQKMLSSCPICLGNLHNPYATDCGHVFCAHCLFALVQNTSRSCPSCRHSLKTCTPYQGRDNKDDHVKLNMSGVVFHVPSTTSLSSLFGLSDQQRLKLIHKGKVISQDSLEDLRELAKKKASLMMLLTAKPQPGPRWSLRAVLEYGIRKLSHLTLHFMALLARFMSPILPPIKLFIDSLLPGFDPKKQGKKKP